MTNSYTMNRINKLFLIFSIVLLWIVLIQTKYSGAQEQMCFTQNEKAQYYYNPAYNKYYNTFGANMLYRNQWTGVDGAPVAQLITTRIPLKFEKLGFSISAMNQKWAFYKNTNAYFGTTYALNFDNNSYLVFGLQIGINSLRIDQQEIIAEGTYDFSNDSYVFPNTGFGLYYQSNRFFVAYAIPEMLFQNQTQNGDTKYSNNFKFENLQMYLYTGYLHEFSYNFKLQPTILLKYKHHSPVQSDFFVNCIIRNKFRAGAGWRTSNDLLFGLEYVINKMFTVSYSYDYTLSELSNLSKGTHEIGIAFRSRTTVIREF